MRSTNIKLSINSISNFFSFIKSSNAFHPDTFNTYTFLPKPVASNRAIECTPKKTFYSSIKLYKLLS